MPKIQNPADLNDMLTDALNVIIQLPQMQNLTWQMESGCRNSTLNDMYFCNSASVSGSINEISHADSTGAHVDTNDHVDTNNHVDSKLVHDDAHFDIGIPGTSSHTDTVPHDDTHDDTHAAPDDTHLPHDDTSAHFDTPAVALKYSMGLTRLTGCGALTVTNLVLAADGVDEAPEVSLPFTAGLVIPSAVTAYGSTSVQQQPLPPLSDNSTAAANNVTGTMTGTITLYCTGNPDGKASGYYASVSTIMIALPSSCTDWGGWSGFVGAIAAAGFDTAWMVGAGNEVVSDLNSLMNSLVAPLIVNELNSLLANQQILSCTC
jgi:hypothetical protein